MKKTSMLIFIPFFFYSYIQSADDPTTRPYFIGRIKKYAKKRKEKRAIEKLFKASEEGDIDSLNTLLAKGVDVNVRGDRDDGWDDDMTPLMQATRFQHVACVRRLLEAGADVNAQTSGAYGDFSALDCAVRTKNRTIFKLHIAYKPNRAILSDAVLTAADSNNTNVIPTLLKKGASTNKRYLGLRTSLMIAARCRRNLIAEQLLADPAIQIDAQDGGTDNTALMYAVSASVHLPAEAESTDMTIAKMLLDRDADVTIKNQRGLTAYDFAQEGERLQEEGFTEIVQLLKERMQPMVKFAARPAVPVVLDVD